MKEKIYKQAIEILKRNGAYFIVPPNTQNKKARKLFIDPIITSMIEFAASEVERVIEERMPEQLSIEMEAEDYSGKEDSNKKQFIDGNEFDAFVAGCEGSKCDEALDEAMQKFAAQQQPTAEGAEEIPIEREILLLLMDFYYHMDEWRHNDNGDDFEVEISSWIKNNINRFATLHAQRLAVKMVSERLLNFIHWLRYRNFTDDTMRDEDWLELYRNDPEVNE